MLSIHPVLTMGRALMLVMSVCVLIAQAQEAVSPRYIPCGTGGVAICDLQTGLMWETKTEAPEGGSGTCPAPLALHAVDLSCSSGEETGLWLEALNAESGTGYAGYTDWRIPHIQELLTLYDYAADTIDPAFGPTDTGSNGIYVSSTPNPGREDSFWTLRFSDGFPLIGGIGRVRAVRGGRGPGEAALRYVPCGAEEIAVCDLETGLMWEVKCGGDVACPDSDVQHAAQAEYRHDQDIGPWLELVNAENGTGYAGYTDWRLPTIHELLSIFDFEVFTDAAPVFGASARGFVWSATTAPSVRSEEFWAVLFGGPRSGSIISDNVSAAHSIRAVRGGR